MRPNDDAGGQEQPHGPPTPPELEACGVRDKVAFEHAQGVLRQRRVDESATVKGVARRWFVLEGEIEGRSEGAVRESCKASKHRGVFHVHFGGEETAHWRGPHGRIRVGEERFKMDPGPRSRVSTKAAPEEAREGKQSACAKAKLTVDAVRNSRRNGCVHASGVERGAVEPPVPDPSRLDETSGEKSVLRSGMPDVRQISVGTGCRHHPAKALLINSSSGLFDRFGLDESHRPKRRVRLDDGCKADVGDAREFARAAAAHLFGAFEPRHTKADHLVFRGALIPVELPSIANVRVDSIKGEARNGASTDVRGRDKLRRGGGLMWNS